MWQRADAIMDHAASPNARFLGLNILAEAIKTRWKVQLAEALTAAYVERVSGSQGE